MLHAEIVLILLKRKHTLIIKSNGINFLSTKTYFIKKLLNVWSEIFVALSLHKSTISNEYKCLISDIKSSAVNEIAEIEQQPKLEGRYMNMILMLKKEK